MKSIDKFYIVSQGKRLSSDVDLKKNSVNISKKSTTGRNRRNLVISIKNNNQKPILIERCGGMVAASDFELDQKGKWRVFIDQGSCAWAGVKALDALEKDAKLGMFEEQRLYDNQQENLPFHRSDMLSVIWNADSKKALLIGFLSQKEGTNKIDVITDEKGGKIIAVEAWQELNTMIPVNKTVNLDPLMIIQGNNPLILMETYAEFVRKYHQHVFDDPPVVGMMTWYGYRTAIDEKIILENANVVGDFFSGYPQKMTKLMLLDNGWQEDANWGLWKPDKKRFSHGMKWLNKKLAETGLKMAIWYTPFCITDNAPNYKKLKQLQSLDKNNKPHVGRCGVWGQLPGHPSSRDVMTFDGARKKVQKKWRNEIHRMRDWGCVYWKLDFFNLRTNDKDKIKYNDSRLYTETWRNFRRTAGKKGHLAPCSCGTNIQTGYCDSIRIATDIGEAGQWPGAMERFRYGMSTIAALWFKQRKFWVNDPDSIQIGRGCSLAEARVRATVVALSGGHLMLSEDLCQINPERLEIVRRLLPPCPIAAKPLDLFENPYPDGYPRYWSLQLDTASGPMITLAVFNLTKKTETYTITPAMLGIPVKKEFLALEWWQYKWLGRFKSSFKIDVPPEDVAVIHACPTTNVPSLLSVSHHITGSYILDKIKFRKNCLTGIIRTKPGLHVVLFGALPDHWKLAAASKYHGKENLAGGWQYELTTSGPATRFKIKFEKSKG